MSMMISRRGALWLAAASIVSCRDARNGADASAPAPFPAPPSRRVASRDAATPACSETHDNIEGPYYRAGAPERTSLVEQGMPGSPLALEGRVMGQGCGRGLAGVELDVWHATHDGHYDNDGSMRAPDARAERYLLRGRLKTDADGRYRIRTIVPGRYMNGRQYRPAHVHVKVRASGFTELTTQLYFPGDPYNDVDPFIHPSLIMGIEQVKGSAIGHFDFVLRQA